MFSEVNVKFLKNNFVYFQYKVMIPNFIFDDYAAV